MNNNKLCENKKWELVNFCEFDKYAEKSYCAIHNVDSSKNLGDITKVDEENLSPFNMICGGSPMSTVGTAMKSILTRMTNIKAGKLELVDEDGTTEKLSDVEATLANVGINLRKTMTEYNSASDVLDALASKWDTLNQAQQNAIAISFSGQRMQNQFRVLMENYDRVQKYTDVAANSEGSGEQKFDLYLEGLEAKTNGEE